MKKTLVEILACPICKNDLSLSIDKEEDEEEVISGTLNCINNKFKLIFNISEGIPNLLPPNNI